MVGQGALRECLLDPNVVEVLSIGRNTTGQVAPKLQEVVAPNLMDISAVAPELKRFDACFFCLGVSSTGMTEADYRRVTFDVTLAVARTLAQQNPDMTFIYVSGAGTDSTGLGRSMWARVKGETENALLALPLKAVMFRPGGIVPLHGIQSRTPLYRILYQLTGPIWPALYRALPQYVTTTEQVGRAMLRVAQLGAPKRILETRDINAL
ncbi:MAG: epimerase [Myxococcaceae bacterium]